MWRHSLLFYCKGWSYSQRKGWEGAFLPVSTTCTNFSNARSWDANHESVQVRVECSMEETSITAAQCLSGCDAPMWYTMTCDQCTRWMLRLLTKVYNNCTWCFTFWYVVQLYEVSHGQKLLWWWCCPSLQDCSVKCSHTHTPVGGNMWGCIYQSCSLKYGVQRQKNQAVVEA